MEAPGADDGVRGVALMQQAGPEDVTDPGRRCPPVIAAGWRRLADGAEAGGSAGPQVLMRCLPRSRLPDVLIPGLVWLGA